MSLSRSLTADDYSSCSSERSVQAELAAELSHSSRCSVDSGSSSSLLRIIFNNKEAPVVVNDLYSAHC
mgnify:CR=1 FL=1